MNNIQHIFFDLDHTLWDFETNSRQALNELYEHFDLLSKLGVEPKIFIQRYELHNAHYWKLYRENRISKSRLRLARFEAVLRDFRYEDKLLVKELARIYLEICPLKTQLFDGAKEVLQQLQSKYEIHIITNGFEEVQWLKIRSSGIDHFFRYVITSEMAKAKKPNPRIFQLAMKLSGANLENSLMIGDNREVDIKGAEDFGWKAIHFDPFGQSGHGMSVRSLRDLPNILL